MKKLSQEDFNTLIADEPIKPRLKKELRFVASTENISDEEWSDRELLAVTDRNGNKGVLLIELDGLLHVLPYELKIGITSSTTGRSQSIICDFCRTWQAGTRAGSITFKKGRTESVSYLCCADLRCSMHVRNKTQAAHTSRAQLREDLSVEERVDRLRARLAGYIAKL